MKLKFLTMGLIAFVMASCGGGKSGKSEEKKESVPVDVTVKAEETACGGSLGKYVSVVAGDYTLQIKGGYSKEAVITVNLSVEAIPELSSDDFGLSQLKAVVTFLDENKTPLSVNIEESYDRELESALKSGAAKLSMKFDGYIDGDEEVKTLVDKAKFIEVSVSGEVKEPSSSSSSSSSSDETETTESAEVSDSKSESKTSSTDINAWLDKYEKAMDKYSSLVKKANNGDLSAVADMASYLEEVNDLYNDLENVKGDMTPAQSARLAKIYAKMSSL